MSKKREVEDGVVPEEANTKRQKVMDQSSPSLPPVAFENPLLPLASYDDDDEDEDDGNRGRIAEQVINNGGNKDQNGYSPDDEEDEDDESHGRSQRKRNRAIEIRRDCPYLDTVNRQVLDFDFEKFCSVSLTNLNVYACLVCGKYYQGRGPKSHAYTHSLEAGHHVFINLRTEKVYCLPDGYEVIDPSLDDIIHVLNPRFTQEQVEQLDKSRQWSRALDGSDYLPGTVGLNNIKETDFVNVTIQSLMRVTPLRNFFLIPENYQHNRSPLVHRFGELTRKIWHARNFKGQVSPHEFLQAVMKASKKRFRIGAQSDPVEFMSWLLNTLHTELRSSKKGSSIIHQCFQGELEVVKEMHNRPIAEKRENGEDGEHESRNTGMETSRMPFLMLGLDLPPPPLFTDVMEKNIIPQVPLFNILKKFDGETVTEVVRPRIARMRYRVTKLPQYLILHMRRFTKNNFFMEKNPTLVNFPVKNLELKDYIPLPAPKDNEKLRSKYDLIANIVHDGKPGEGSYRVFVQRKSEELWYEMQDLHVSETLPQMVALSETYMQIYEQHQQ
ncbi:U4/U6.U5 tri-snRNP-associated protein 2 [Capsicum baccatum]|uniref:U4/U6.U5 tri-snRNP-associated protein 2 n=1 Tax=Capsicum baccatum TaxID=33114 RepID=A0A2G2XD80_CAPBA|nr:U4/U6.U5 tri-snRNP-associated protein 2 [Capsicum baccatum]